MGDIRDLYQASDNNDITRIDYDGSGNQIYIGRARPGSLTSDANWRIQQINYTTISSVLYQSSILFAGSSPSYTQVWDNRASLVYG